MSGPWPPNPSQYPQQGGQQQPYQGQQGPEQGYGGYAPPSQGGQRPPYQGYGTPGQGYGEYPQPGWQQGGWPQEASWAGGGTSQQVPPATYPGQGGAPQGYPYGAPYGQQQYGNENSYRNSTPAPAKRRPVLLIVIAVVAVVLIGGAASAYALLSGHPSSSTGQTSALATGTPGIPAGFRAYTDSAAKVRFALPNDWTTTGTVSGPTGLEGISADQNSFIIAKQYNFVGNNTGAADGALTGAAGSGGSVANKVGPTSVSMAGTTWTQESADITRDSVTLHMVVLVTTHDQSTYLFGYFSLTSDFTSANASYFQPIAHSFTFTG